MPSDKQTTFDRVFRALVVYYLSALVVVAGVGVGRYCMPNLDHDRGSVIDAFARWDGKWYGEIARSGYSYDPEKPSNVAFFPAFPLLARSVSMVTGLEVNAAMLLVAHICLAAAFVVMAMYLQHRLAKELPSVQFWAILSMAVLPTTFFFRMAYSESLFLLTAVLALYGMERRWPLLVIALIAGLATATRPVGVALLPVFFLHIWSNSPSRKAALMKFVPLMPVACWGIVGYMLFQWMTFGDALVFARTQHYWRMRPPVPFEERVLSLVTLEPIWSIYDPSSPCHWGCGEPDANPLVNLQIANPLFFLLTVGLIGLGGVKRWLTHNEMILAAGLLLIPYVTRSHEMCMSSMGRFAAVVFPVYLVLGRILGRMPAPAAALVLALSGFWMGIYAALFASWHRIF